IDTFVDVTAEWIANSLRIQGAVRGDDFPNAEVFVLDANGVGCMLFDGRTTGGRDSGPFTRLAGEHAEQRLGSFYWTMGLLRDGIFRGPRVTCATTVLAARTSAPPDALLGAGGTSRNVAT